MTYDIEARFHLAKFYEVGDSYTEGFIETLKMLINRKGHSNEIKFCIVFCDDNKVFKCKNLMRIDEIENLIKEIVTSFIRFHNQLRPNIQSNFSQ